MTIRWMSARAQSIALLVSLAVNVLLISAIAAYALQGHHHRDRGDRMHAAVERMAGRLPDGDAARLRSAYAAHLDEFKAARDEVRRLRESVRTALHAQPFDPKAFQQAAQKLTDRRAAMDRAFVNVVTGAVIQMSPEGRARLLDRRRDR